MQEKKITSFVGELAAALENNTFAKATVGNYKGPEEQLQKVLLRRINTKRGDMLQFVFRYGNRDVAKNFGFADGLLKVVALFNDGFRSARLFTVSADFQLEFRGDKGVVLSRSKPTFSGVPGTGHDRPKDRPIDPDRKFLKLLGISTAEGRVKDKQQAKFRQINRFVTILEDLIIEAGVPEGRPLRIADMGSGKGYLTFALYDHLKNGLGIDVRILGIEERPELVETCGSAAAKCGFEGLSFSAGRIADSDLAAPDVLIALHACDTATDDALYRGITSNCRVIVAAPCCQKELRKELRFPEPLEPLNDYGLLLERETESITDGLRAVLLEHCGYGVRMFEFISPEHTPKNNLITAVLNHPSGNTPAPSKEARAIMRTFGISSQRLESLLSHHTLPDAP